MAKTKKYKWQSNYRACAMRRNGKWEQITVNTHSARYQYPSLTSRECVILCHSPYILSVRLSHDVTNLIEPSNQCVTSASKTQNHTQRSNKSRNKLTTVPES